MVVNGFAGTLAGFIQKPLQFTEKQAATMLTISDGYLYKTSLTQESAKNIANAPGDENFTKGVNKFVKGLSESR